MTFWQAAERVLSETKDPLTADQIVERASRAGLIASKGKTPHRAMSAVLYLRAKRDDRLERVYTPGARRARRGTVKWRLTGRTLIEANYPG